MLKVFVATLGVFAEVRTLQIVYLQILPESELASMRIANLVHQLYLLLHHYYRHILRLVIRSYEDHTAIRSMCLILCAVLKPDVLACLEANYTVTFGLTAFTSLFSTFHSHLRQPTLKYQWGPCSAPSGPGTKFPEPESHRRISALLAGFKSVAVLKLRVSIDKFTPVEVTETVTETLSTLSNTVRHVIFNDIFSSDPDGALNNHVFPFAFIQSVVPRAKLLHRVTFSATHFQEVSSSTLGTINAIVREGLQQQGLLLLPTSMDGRFKLRRGPSPF
ncbi:hypothetical protein EUX98_g4031 [Antrodiella citrinella]|uniref:Uncharacterized protein n=1 Tax=Antrodiella citrinella TaxID=2447956 RepID=A0A4S4MUZ3_9APHY|nr:hypothetical protein EUX98_g4031 [Antrodiella citrinella]